MEVPAWPCIHGGYSESLVFRFSSDKKLAVLMLESEGCVADEDTLRSLEKSG